MANVNITEFNSRDAPLRMPALAVQNVAISGSSVQSSAFTTSTQAIRVSCDAIAWIAFGPNPTAIAAGAGTVRFALGESGTFGVSPGDKVAVITGT